ncbi:MAG: ribonuclease H family protein [Planctomycetota bacterium]
MAIVAGIDEAGFGPVLGPLVVSSAAFSVPEELMGVSMYRLLAGAVCRKPSRKRRDVAIADSKRLYTSTRNRPLEHLERGVLAMLAARDSRPVRLSGLMAAIAPRWRDRAPEYPWYDGGELPLPRCASETDISLAANVLSVAMARASVTLLDISAEPVFVGEFNRMTEATRNKSVTLMSITGRLLMRLWQDASGGPLRVYVDRQGGRVRYLSHLQRMFEGVSFKIVDETEAFSAYSMTDGRRTAEIIFGTSCDERHLPAALASMTSKYVRELFMTLINGFWCRRVPGLVPTAGYWTDGRRFFGQILPAVRELEIDERLVYRCR